MSEEDFYYILSGYGEDDELVKLISKGLDKHTLYRALRNTYLIAYNALIVRERIEFQFKDVDNLVIPIKKLAEELNKQIKDKDKSIEKAFKICKNNYLKTASDLEQKETKTKVPDGSSYMIYDYNVIPDDTWKRIKADIIKKIDK